MRKKRRIFQSSFCFEHYYDLFRVRLDGSNKLKSFASCDRLSVGLNKCSQFTNKYESMKVKTSCESY